MEWIQHFKSNKGISTFVLFFLFLTGLIIYGQYSGLFLILSVFVFGAMSVFWKEKELRIIAMAAMVLLAVVNIGINGMKFGIDFSGGTRIPVVLEHSVDDKIMSELVGIIKKRSSVLGLSEVKVVSLGDSEINIEVPSSNQEQIKFIEEVLAHQGVYEGVVDGVVAVTGEDILPGSVQRTPTSQLSPGSDWGVSFTISSKSAQHFSEVIRGKANYPLYMFLDMPKNSIIILDREALTLNGGDSVSVDDLISSCEDVLKYNGTNKIEFYYLDDLDENSSFVLRSNLSKAILPENSPKWLVSKLNSSGFEIVEMSSKEIAPTYSSDGATVSDWDAIGLLSSPRLSPSITDEHAVVGTFYSISGPAKGYGAEKTKDAENSVKRIISVLKGGALPVQISLGSKTVLPPQLGYEFLKLSFIAIVSALVIISIVVGLKYKRIKLILPVIIISVSELIILISILGSFTIDLAAMAGIIAAVGVGVDAQIVITDELLKKQGISLNEKLDKALEIIKTNAIVAIVGMFPLLFSGMIEVIGFAISTILGALLGFLLSRPAYASIVEDILEDHEKEK